MKRLLIIICSCLLYIGLCSAKTKIYLERKQKKRPNAFFSHRTNGQPRRQYHLSTIRCLHKGTSSDRQRRKKEHHFSEFISLSSQQSYALSIGDAKEGIYILELNDGKEEYYGYFEIY